MRKLPSLTSLRAFEAAARRGSFARAAIELNVTATAISHQIRSLENMLDQQLFERKSRTIVLTDVGTKLYPVVARALDELAEGIAGIARGRGNGELSLTTTSSFFSKWLTPRIPDFKAAYPDIDLRLGTSSENVDLDASGYDCAIRFGNGSWRGLISERLTNKPPTPVCSPEYLESTSPIRVPDDLHHHTLLHVSPQLKDWSRWFTALGVSNPELVGGPIFDLWGSAIQASINGLGIALGHSPLVDDDIAAGLLVRPLPVKSVPDDNAFYFVYRKAFEQSAALTAFRNWLFVETDLTHSST